MKKKILIEIKIEKKTIKVFIVGHLIPKKKKSGVLID